MTTFSDDLLTSPEGLGITPSGTSPELLRSSLPPGDINLFRTYLVIAKGEDIHFLLHVCIIVFVPRDIESEVEESVRQVHSNWPPLLKIRKYLLREGLVET